MRERPRVAIVAPFSGPRRAWGDLLLRAAARRDDIDWLRIDDRGEAALGAVCAGRAVAAGAVAAIGHFNSGGAALALPEYARAGVPCLLPLATAPGLTALAPGLVLRQCPTDDDQARALVDALGAVGDEVAVIDDGSAYGMGLAELIAASGATPLALDDAILWDGGLVVSGVHRPAAAIARELVGEGCVARLAFVDDCDVDEFAALAGEAVDGALVARFPGGASACVDAMVDALADAVTTWPMLRGSVLVEAVRALSAVEYDDYGERLNTGWGVRPVALAGAHA